MNYLSKLYQLGSLPVIRPDATQKIAVTPSAAQSGPVNANVVRLLSTVDCHIAFGTAPVVDTTGLFLPANTPEYFACYATDQVAVISDGASGSLYLTPAAEV